MSCRQRNPAWPLLPIAVVAAVLGAAGCGSSGTSSAGAYTVGGTVAGLQSGQQLTLLDNGADSLTLAHGGAFTFKEALPNAARYAVTVATPPAGQTCTVAGGSGTINSANVANAVVTCSSQSFTLGGSIRGLNGSGLVLKSGGETLGVAAGATQFTMPTPVASGSAYSVTVLTQPTGLACGVQSGSGTMPAANVSSVVVNCTAQSYTLGGTVSGLGANAGLVLANGADSQAVAPGATTFTLAARVSYGAQYAVTVQSAPAGLQCAVNNPSGTMPAANVSNLAVVCSPQTYAVGGTLSGLSASGLVLANGADTLAVPGRSGSFTMPGALPTGAHYDIVVQSQPLGLTCAVANGSGTVGAVAVTDVAVVCGTGSFTVGGSISGLGASGLVLANGSDTLAVLANAATFTLPSGLPLGASYDVRVLAHPPGVDCSITNGSGSVGNADVNDIAVACGPGSESVLHAFAGALADGTSPYASLLAGADGNFYGVTYTGGAYGLGCVFRIAADGTESVLHSFGGGADGANPHGSLIQASDGNFYGTTAYGGSNGQGVVFVISAAGVESVLYTFGSGTDAQQPYGGLLQASDGNLYGTSLAGGANGVGAVFAVSLQGAESVLYSFGALPDGQAPFGGLIQAQDGELYGTTSAGGAYGAGTVFRVTLLGAESVVHSFGANTDGADPSGALVQTADGTLYGLTRDGGTNSTGTVFAIAADGTESLLYSFAAGPDGVNPYGDLLLASDGNFYALTPAGGANNAGALVQITPGGSEAVLYSFGAGSDGQTPYGTPIESADGTLYGLTSAGGAGGGGTVFQVN